MWGERDFGDLHLEDLPSGILGGKGLGAPGSSRSSLSSRSVRQLEMKVQRCVKSKAGVVSCLEHSEDPGVGRYTGNSF